MPLAASAIAGTGSSAEIDAPKRLFCSWLSDRGVVMPDGLYLSSDEHTGPGVFTSRALNADTEVVRLPASLVITSVHARRALEHLAAELGPADGSTAESAAVALRQDLAELSQHDVVVLYLFLARALLTLQPDVLSAACTSAPSSPLHPLLQHVPYVSQIPAHISTPLHYRRAETALLRGTPLFSATFDRRVSTRSACAQALSWLCKLRWDAPSARLPAAAQLGAWVREGNAAVQNAYKDGAAWEEATREPEDEPAALQLWRWAEWAYGSRAFPPHLAYPQHAGPSDVKLKGKRWHGEELAPILIPGLDAINHGRARKVTWNATRGPASEGSAAVPASEGDDADGAQDLPRASDTISLQLHEALAAGEQVLNNYGAKSNEEFLGSYGFVIEGGPDDAVTLVIGGHRAADWLPPEERKRCYWTRTTKAVPEDLFDTVVSMLGIEPPSDAVASSLSSASASASAGDTRAAHAAAARADPEIQLEVHETLAQMFAAKLRTLKACMRGRADEQQVCTRAARPEIARMVDIYVQGQLEILQSALDITSETADRLASEL